MDKQYDPFIRVYVTDLQGVPLLEVSGEVDLGTLPQLQRALERALSRNGNQLILDLRKVSFIDSSGVGALISAKKALLSRRGELHLICGDDHVRRKLGIMRLANILRLHSTPEEAYKDISSPMASERS
ncbi:MAG TPA: STAS domain-containing protein [Armatimonadota bacterium]